MNRNKLRQQKISAAFYFKSQVLVQTPGLVDQENFFCYQNYGIALRFKVNEENVEFMEVDSIGRLRHRLTNPIKGVKWLVNSK